jgi:hypothetical protein
VRELRVASCRQLALDLGEPGGEDRWDMLPEPARLRVLALLAVMIAQAALTGPGDENGACGG